MCIQFKAKLFSLREYTFLPNKASIRPFDTLPVIIFNNVTLSSATELNNLFLFLQQIFLTVTH